MYDLPHLHIKAYSKLKAIVAHFLYKVIYIQRSLRYNSKPCRLIPRVRARSTVWVRWNLVQGGHIYKKLIKSSSNRFFAITVDHLKGKTAHRRRVYARDACIWPVMTLIWPACHITKEKHIFLCMPLYIL